MSTQSPSMGGDLSRLRLVTSESAALGGQPASALMTFCILHLLIFLKQNPFGLRIYIYGTPGGLLSRPGCVQPMCMTLRDLIFDVLRTLWSHKLRAFLTMFGIAWGIVSIVLMVAAGEGLRKGQEEQARNLGKDVMIVFHGRTSLQAGGTHAGRVVHWEDRGCAGGAGGVAGLRVCDSGAGAGYGAHAQQFQ